MCYADGMPSTERHSCLVIIFRTKFPWRNLLERNPAQCFKLKGSYDYDAGVNLGKVKSGTSSKI